MTHIVLLGDSVFDNAVYVPDGLPVLDHLRQLLTGGDRATLLAIDGDCINDVAAQLTRLPSDTTHLVVSVGGNDALRYGAVLQANLTVRAPSLPTILQDFAEMKAEFSQAYRRMLHQVLAMRLPTAIATIYDQCPVSDPILGLLATTILPMFNDCITRQSVELQLPLLDLRVLCNQPSDYSTLSPIEPSSTGGAKIAQAIADLIQHHNLS